MKNRVTIVGIGQAGGNIAQLFDDLGGYNTLVINTSLDDIKTLSVKNSYHIPDAEGCNKIRRNALEFAKGYHQQMVDKIVETVDKNKNKNEKVKQNILFCFSLGGGTGSGIAPLIMKKIAQDYKEFNIMGVCVMPNKEESPIVRENAIKCSKQIFDLKGIGSLYMIDNNNLNKFKDNKFELNKDFVERFDRLLNITIPDERGVIDKAELQQALSIKGFSILAYYIEDELKYGSFSPNNKTSTYKVLITSSKERELKYKEFKGWFGTSKTQHNGFNNEINFVGAFGLPNPTATLEEIVLESTCEVDEIKNEVNENNFEIPDQSIFDIDISFSDDEEVEEKEENDDDFWDDIENNY